MAEIRRYAAGDEAACVAILASNSPRYFDPGDVAEFRHFLANPGGDYFVALVGGAVRGCGGCYVTDMVVGGLTWGMVHADDHRRGLGSELLRFRLDVIRTVPYAWCVLLNTTQLVVPFYERFGFRTFRVVADGCGPGLDKHSMRLVWATG